MEENIASLSLEQLQRKAREIIEIPLWDVVSVAGGGWDDTTGGSAADVDADAGDSAGPSDRDAVRYYYDSTEPEPDNAATDRDRPDIDAFIASYLRPPGRHRTGRRGFEHGAGPAIGELGRGGRRSTGWETTDNEEDASDTSRSTVGAPSASDTVDSKVFETVYDELIKISGLLSERSETLATSEDDFRHREAGLEAQQRAIELELRESFDAEVSAEVEERMRLLQSDLSASQQRERAAQSQSQESRRQRRAYEELRDINSELRRGLATADAEVEKLGKKVAASQRRIRSLEAARHTREQRERLGGDSLARSNRGLGDSMAASLRSASTVSLQSTASAASQATSLPAKPKMKRAVDVGLTQAALRVLTACLQSLELPELEQTNSSSQHLVGQCRHLLPDMVVLFPALGVVPEMQLPFLQFVLWALRVASGAAVAATLTTTYRRIGDEVFTPPPGSESSGTAKKGWMGPDGRRDCRIIACLIGLATLQQADQLAATFETIRQDLLCFEGKQLFARYAGPTAMLGPMSEHMRAVLRPALDVLLTLTMDSGGMEEFVASLCSDEWMAWFRRAFDVTRAGDVKLLEKLAVVLQKVSKRRESHGLFLKHKLDGSIRDTLKEMEASGNQFVVLNFRSVLMNVG